MNSSSGLIHHCLAGSVNEPWAKLAVDIPIYSFPTWLCVQQNPAVPTKSDQIKYL